MKLTKLFFITLLALWTGTAFAQEAPDFVVTDVEGNDIALYQYLDAGHVVVLDLMFVNCQACTDLAPYIQESWQGYDNASAAVTFMALTSDPADHDIDMIAFGEEHGITYPLVSAEGGSVNAQLPFTSGLFGAFYGYPTLVVIAPNGEVFFDPWGTSYDETIDALEDFIDQAMETLTSVDEVVTANFVSYPNPASSYVNFQWDAPVQDGTALRIVNLLGQPIRKLTTKQGDIQTGLDVSDLPSGFYLVQAVMDDEVVSTSRIQVSR